MTEDPRLDTLQGCVEELVTCNRLVAEIQADFPQHAGELAMLEKRYDRLYKSAMRGTEGKNADERKATAHAAVEASHEQHYGFSISERIEELIGDVESHKRTMETVNRRSGNAQSILKARRDEQTLERYVRPE